MLLYYVKSKKAAAAAAAMMTDGKKPMVIYAGDVMTIYGADGQPVETRTEKRHADAVEVWPGMTEKENKNAHRVAAMRDTLRTKEEAADDLLQAGDAMTAAERAALLKLVNVAFHTSGKIEGVNSIDSTAACEFCAMMRAAAVDNILMICGACYAAADAYKEASWRTHKLNARILSSVLFSADELKALNISAAECRFNEDGDTVNVIMARNYLRIAATRPGAFFGYWYKNVPAVEAGLHAEGYHTRADLPANVRFIHSSPVIGFEAAATWFDDAIFTVYPDAATTAAAIAAGAWACNGRKCMACGYNCYRMPRTDKPLHIAEYLRTGAATRAAILQAYYNLKAQQAGRAC